MTDTHKTVWPVAALLLTLLLIPGRAAAIDIVVRTDSSMREAFADLDEPPQKDFPLVVYVSQNARSMSRAIVATDRLQDREFTVPHYIGMLLVYADHSTAFVPATASYLHHACLLQKYGNRSRPNPAPCSWIGLSERLYWMQTRGAIFALAKPGEAPDPTFMPRYSNARAVTVSQMNESPTIEHEDRTLLNPKPGMRLIAFKTVHPLALPGSPYYQPDLCGKDKQVR